MPFLFFSLTFSSCSSCSRSIKLLLENLLGSLFVSLQCLDIPLFAVLDHHRCPLHRDNLDSTRLSASQRSEDLLALGGPQSEQQALDSLTEVFQS